MSERCKLCKCKMLPTKKGLYICDTIKCPTIYARENAEGFRYFLVSESKLRLIDLNVEKHSPSDQTIIDRLET